MILEPNPRFSYKGVHFSTQNFKMMYENFKIKKIDCILKENLIR